MDGIVTLLNDAYYQEVERLWDELEQAFGLKDIAPTPIPHFSYQIAEKMDIAGVEPVLRQIARETLPFKVVTTGLGIFTGAGPVLYVPLVRIPPLNQLHHRVWDAAYPYGTTVTDYYNPFRWVPHITLADDNIDNQILPDLIRLLSARNFMWELTVDNLAIIHNAEDGSGIDTRIALG